MVMIRAQTFLQGTGKLSHDGEISMDMSLPLPGRYMVLPDGKAAIISAVQFDGRLCLLLGPSETDKVA